MDAHQDGPAPGYRWGILGLLSMPMKAVTFLGISLGFLLPAVMMRLFPLSISGIGLGLPERRAALAVAAKEA